jgi:hypothetical protein
MWNRILILMKVIDRWMGWVVREVDFGGCVVNGGVLV